MADGVFFVSVKSNHPTWYLIGIIFFLLLGIALLVGGGISHNMGMIIPGAIVTLGSVVLLIEFIATR